MSMFYGSGVSHSNRSLKDRAGSSASAIGRLTNAKEVAHISAVVGNGAHDSALQINGHVADKINHVNIKYLFISYHGDGVKAVANAGSAPPLPTTTLVHPRLSVSAERSNRFNIIEQTEIPSLKKTKRNIKLLSKVTGETEIICVISSRKVEVGSVTWDSRQFCSTGRFVDLLIPMPGSAKNIAQRFHILKDCPFDMLLGMLTTRPSVR
ncbi:hypothetical protein CC77DRAFT_205464 [Alternaria alternata]|uniref:Uncharacterized protein n=1 Tax=Alternaria alternata TaxID=5599 RepID=A0A177DGR5_ALTAL|nr:hypothetical protein CC77DRAFT_205464 [Alternaria alternata]OAG18676.1 hypothetical protein CC77DRAFT_205464 [Alternaria alternata]